MFKKTKVSILFVVPIFLFFVASAKMSNNEGNSLTKSITTASIDGGTITGVVRFPGEYPKTEKITVTKDQKICGAFKYSEAFIVSENNQGLKNVVVSVLSVNGDEKLPEASSVTLEQKKCQYVPHVQAVPIGTKLQIINDDGLLHNVHAYLGGLNPKDTVFNKAQPKFLKKINQNLDKAGIYYFKCDVHGHMNAFIAVMDHPYFAVTNDLGEFTIDNVPAGSYKVQAWHESLGNLFKEVNVQPGKAVQVNFDILPNE